MFNFIDLALPKSVHSNLPVVGHGKEPEWLTRKVAATGRLRELKREQTIVRLQSGRDETPGVVMRMRAVLGLA